jgi:hypothetical protein
MAEILRSVTAGRMPEPRDRRSNPTEGFESLSLRQTNSGSGNFKIRLPEGPEIPAKLLLEGVAPKAARQGERL